MTILSSFGWMSQVGTTPVSLHHCFPEPHTDAGSAGAQRTLVELMMDQMANGAFVYRF